MNRSQAGYGRIKWALLILSRPKSLLVRIKYRTINRALDLRAVLAGACNATTWDPKRSTFRGGYSHWRCARRHGHYPVTPHRSNNYVWATGGRTEFDPISINSPEYASMSVRGAWMALRGVETPFQRYAGGRRPIQRLSQERASERAAQAAMAARRAERRANGVT